MDVIHATSIPDPYADFDDDDMFLAPVKRSRRRAPAKARKICASTEKLAPFYREAFKYACEANVIDRITARMGILVERDPSLGVGDAYWDRSAKLSAPLVLKYLYDSNADEFTRLARMACDCCCNRTTFNQAVALTDITFREQPITCRGDFYRAVSSSVYPDTAERYYRQSNDILLKLRRGGIIPYEFIVDGTRRTEKPSSWSGLADYMDTVERAYRCDLWQRQKDYIEIFVEKDAMAAVLTPVTYEYDVRLRIIRGGCSETFAWEIAQHWQQIQKPIYAYYLGDHDPSGLSIERDLRERLFQLSDGVPFNWQRVAVTQEDFQRPDLIGFAIKGNRNSKTWRTKHKQYLGDHGDRCVEVDAIASTEIRERIKAVIESHIEPQEWQAQQHQEALERATFKEFVLAQKMGLKAG